MNETYRYALIFSVLFHAFIIIEWPFYNNLLQRGNVYKDIEVTYLNIKEAAALNPQKERPSKAAQDKPSSPQPAKMVAAEPSRITQSQGQKIEASKKGSLVSEAKKEAAKIERGAYAGIEQPAVKPKEGLTAVDLKSQHLVPQSYAQVVRSKIKKNLDAAKSTLKGDVFVRFTISGDGELKELKIIDENSTRDGLLRETVFEAIKKSSPFPGFPADAAVREAAFTCQISFEPK